VRAAGRCRGPWYVGAAVRRAQRHHRASAAAAAAVALLVLAGCGGARRDAGAPSGTFAVDVQRATFAPRQHLAQRGALVISVRNAGDRAIPDLTVTVHGFTDRSGGPRDADLGRDLWIVDRGPAGAATAFEDIWTAGRLEPHHTATLRWEVTPVVAGTHRLTYEIAPATVGPARARLTAGGVPRGTLEVRVTDKPAATRVDPRTGAVRRQE
jgi:hypothetical protein